MLVCRLAAQLLMKLCLKICQPLIRIHLLSVSALEK